MAGMVHAIPAMSFSVARCCFQLSNAAMIAMKIGEDSVENRMPSRANESPTLYRAA